MFKRVSIFVVLLAAIAASAPASAGPVTVTLDLSFLGQVTDAADYKSCSVQITDGADGVAVLSRALRDGCIQSYELSTFPEGTFVDCIDDVCGNAATYWRMTENGTSTSYGVDGFSAAAGDVLGFSYTIWVGCLADESLC